MSLSSKTLFHGRSSSDSLPDSLRSISKRNCVTAPVSITLPESTMPSLDMVYGVAGPQNNRQRSDVTVMLMCLVSGPRSPCVIRRKLADIRFALSSLVGSFFIDSQPSYIYIYIFKKLSRNIAAGCLLFISR